MNKNKTVLFISDSHEQFALTAAFLRSDGYSVRFEKVMIECLPRENVEPPELIISELAIPQVDGLQLCRRVRQDIDMANTPVLLVGDLSKQSAIVADSFRCGATEYVQKPVDELRLTALCRAMLSSKTNKVEVIRENLSDLVVGDSSDLTTIIDADDGTILFASPSAKELLGYSTGDLLGKRLFDLIHPRDVNETTAYLESLRWGPTTPIDHRILRKHGSWKLLESTARPINDPRFGSVFVITTREKQLRSNSLLDHCKENSSVDELLNGSESGIALFSRSGHFIEGNAALLRMLDYAPEELLNMSLSEFVFSDAPDTDKMALGELFCGRRDSYEFNNLYFTAEGEVVRGTLKVVAIRGDGEPECFIAIFECPDRRSTAMLHFEEVNVESGDLHNNLFNSTRWSVDERLINLN